MWREVRKVQLHIFTWLARLYSFFLSLKPAACNLSIRRNRNIFSSRLERKYAIPTYTFSFTLGDWKKSTLKDGLSKSRQTFKKKNGPLHSPHEKQSSEMNTFQNLQQKVCTWCRKACKIITSFAWYTLYKVVVVTKMSCRTSW